MTEKTLMEWIEERIEKHKKVCKLFRKENTFTKGCIEELMLNSYNKKNKDLSSIDLEEIKRDVKKAHHLDFHIVYPEDICCPACIDLALKKLMERIR